jgi:hypothetical protein
MKGIETKKEIESPPRFNTSSGVSHKAPDVKVSGTRLVAEVMLKAETPQRTSNGKPIRFEIGPNEAKHTLG